MRTEFRGHFHPAAKAFHWLVAALVFVVWPLGFFGGLAAPDSMGDIFFWHKALGFLILWVMLARLCVRFLTARPARPIGVAGWQNMIASLNQWLLYLALIAQPIIGYLLATGDGKAYLWFGVLPMPSLTGKLSFGHELREIHEYVGYLILGLFLLHLCGVLFHRIIRRDDTLAHMT